MIVDNKAAFILRVHLVTFKEDLLGVFFWNVEQFIEVGDEICFAVDEINTVKVKGYGFNHGLIIPKYLLH